MEREANLFPASHPPRWDTRHVTEAIWTFQGQLSSQKSADAWTIPANTRWSRRTIPSNHRVLRNKNAWRLSSPVCGSCYKEISNCFTGSVGFSVTLMKSLNRFVSIGLKLRCCQLLVTKKSNSKRIFIISHDIKFHVRVASGLVNGPMVWLGTHVLAILPCCHL